MHDMLFAEEVLNAISYGLVFTILSQNGVIKAPKYRVHGVQTL